MTILKVSALFLALVFRFSLIAAAGTEEMVAMPRIQPTRSFTVPNSEKGEELMENRGFGDKEPETKMMNLMMVEGSGYEGMDMDAMKAGDMKTADSKISEHGGHSKAAVKADPKENAGEEVRIIFSHSLDTAKVGPNVYEFRVEDSKTGKPLSGLKPTAEVYMTSMDMGTETPRVKELTPGHYQVKAVFSMQGPWALKVTTSRGAKVFPITAEKSSH